MEVDEDGLLRFLLVNLIFIVEFNTSTILDIFELFIGKSSSSFTFERIRAGGSKVG